LGDKGLSGNQSRWRNALADAQVVGQRHLFAIAGITEARAVGFDEAHGVATWALHEIVLDRDLNVVDRPERVSRNNLAASRGRRSKRDEVSRKHDIPSVFILEAQNSNLASDKVGSREQNQERQPEAPL